MIRVFAPASIGNVGPGFDILGLAFDQLGDIIGVEITTDKSSIDSVIGRDAHKIPMDPKKNCAVIAAEEMLRIKGVDKRVRISIERELPVSGGLGASAASCVGAAIGAAEAAGVTATQEEILMAALAGEELVAGRHLDNIAPCLLGGLTLVVSVAPPIVQALPMTAEWWICIMTPQGHVETKEARKVLPKSLTTELWVSQMQNAVGLTTALAIGDKALARRSFTDYFSEPNRCTLIPDFHEIKTVALKENAIGCTISGSGPTVFALFEYEHEALSCEKKINSLSKDHLIHTMTGRLGSRGAHTLNKNET